MSFDENSPAFRRQSIYLFFKIQSNVFQTTELLRRGFPDITFKEVDAWFTRFKTGSRDIETDVVVDDDARGLDGIPNNLKRKIMESVDFSDQKSLLSVNQDFRNILKADRRIYKDMKVSLGKNSFALSLSNEITGTEVIRFGKRADGGCEKRKGDEVTVLPGSYVEEGIKRFKKAIEKHGTKIESMTIGAKDFSKLDDKTDVGIFCAEVGRTINELSEKLHVEHLDVQLFKKEDLQPILDGIKVGSLKMLILGAQTAHFSYKFSECPSLEQHFPHLIQVTTDDADFDIPLEGFAHIRYLVTDVGTIEPEEIEKYKERIMESEEFKDHSIFGMYSREKIKTALQPFDEADEFEDYDGILRAPGKQAISFRFSQNFIDFVKIGSEP